MEEFSGYSGLHKASEAGNNVEVLELLKSGEEGSIDDLQNGDGGRTALMLAALQGHPVVVETLKAAGADVNTRSIGDGATALHLACSAGHNEIAISLMNGGANKDTQDCSGFTALIHAIRGGHVPVAQTLVSSGAKLTGPRWWSISPPKTAMHYAAEGGDLSMVMALLCYRENGYPELPLAVASHRGHLSIVEAMLDKGAAINCCLQDLRGGIETPLQSAAFGGRHEIVTYLLSKGADLDKTTKSHRSALMLAASMRHPRVVSVLVDAGADLTLHDAFGYTALMSAVEGACLRTVKILLKAGSDTKGRGQISLSALHVADEETCPGVTGLLLEAGADIEAKTVGGGVTPFASAAFEGNLQSMRILLQSNAEVNSRSGNGATPLHMAVKNYNCLEATVSLLLRSGADETMKNEDGHSPMDVLGANSRLHPFVKERVRQLLENAPKDRKWRRRGWLVMLRARVLKAAEVVVATETDKKRGGGGGRSGGEYVVYLADFLVQLNEEGVFRGIVAFL